LFGFIKLPAVFGRYRYLGCYLQVSKLSHLFRYLWSKVTYGEVPKLSFRGCVLDDNLVCTDADIFMKPRISWKQSLYYFAIYVPLVLTGQSLHSYLAVYFISFYIHCEVMYFW
jgi:hypothetical protein